MAILGSIVDQMSASTAVPVVPKAGQRDRNDPRIEDSMERKHTCWIIDDDFSHEAGADDT